MENDFTFGSDGDGSITALLWNEVNGAQRIDSAEKGLVREVLMFAIFNVCLIGRRAGELSKETQREIAEDRAWIEDNSRDDYYSFNGSWDLIFGDEMPASKARAVILNNSKAIAARWQKQCEFTKGGYKRYSKVAKVRGVEAA